MQTFIIPWAPSGSGYTVEQLQRDLPNPDYGLFTWHAEHLGKARSGDNFYLVCNEGEPFVAMRGFFLSDPEDGSVELRPTFISWPAGNAPRFFMDTLDRETPGFSWRLYTEGNPLPEWAGKKLRAFFDLFLERAGESFFDGIHAECSRKPAANVDDAIGIAAEVCCDELNPLDGRPASLWALRPALQFKKDESVISCVLRDILGRCGWTPGKLRDRGFPESIVDRLVLLKGEEGETPEDRLLLIGHSGDRIAFKIAADDLEYKMAHDSENAREGHLRNLGLLYEVSGLDYEL
jgi:hypothetical protein